MIRSHRRRHRLIFLVLAVLLPWVLALALAARKPFPALSTPNPVTGGTEVPR